MVDKNRFTLRKILKNIQTLRVLCGVDQNDTSTTAGISLLSPQNNQSEQIVDM